MSYGSFQASAQGTEHNQLDLRYIALGGETLKSVLRQNKVKFRDVRRLNPWEFDDDADAEEIILYSGQALHLYEQDEKILMPPPPSAIMDDGTRVHVVQHNQTCFEIAAQYDTTEAETRAANRQMFPAGCKVTLLPGQELMIPAAASLFAAAARLARPGDGAYAVQKGDTIKSVAAKHGVTNDELKEANNIPSSYGALTVLQAGRRLSLPAHASAACQALDDRPVLHTVAHGDTLESVREIYGITEAEIRNWNRAHIPKGHATLMLRTGMQLVIRRLEFA